MTWLHKIGSDKSTSITAKEETAGVEKNLDCAVKCGEQPWCQAYEFDATTLACKIFDQVIDVSDATVKAGSKIWGLGN